MRRARSICCASTVSGYAANAAPINVMNSRSLMGFSKGRRWKSSTFFVLRVTWQGAVHVRFVPKADIWRLEWQLAAIHRLGLEMIIVKAGSGDEIESAVLSAVQQQA